MAIAQPTAPRVLGDLAPRAIATQALLVVGGAAFVGISAQVSIPLPFTPVPLTGQTFAVLLVGASLGSVRGVLSLALYALLGAAGVPWLAGGSSGWSAPSFGYVLGFIAAAWAVGRLAERGWTRTPLRTAAAMVAGNLVIYAIGVTYLKLAIDVTWVKALSLGVIPFLVGDLIKVALAAGLFPLAWRLVRRAEERAD